MLSRRIRQRSALLLAVSGVLTGALVAALDLFANPPAATPAAPVQPAQTKFIVHEWGTFLSVQGSDGVTLGGMVASEEALPPFVEFRNLGSWSRTRTYMKMETPVTYFYADQPMTVRVRVDMPKGLLTHWYPAVRFFGPDLAGKPVAGAPIEKPLATPFATTGANSFLDWGNVGIIPHTAKGLLIPPMMTPFGLTPSGDVPALWRVKEEDPWKFARQTDAALVRVNNRTWGSSPFDYEKFLFYRGLGTFDTPLMVRSTETKSGLTLAMHNRAAQSLQGVFAVVVHDGTLRYVQLADLAGDGTRELSVGGELSALGPALPLNEGVGKVKAAVAGALVKAGLYDKEAWAMVNSWEKSYFRTEGIRLLYVLPREAVDSYIPIQILPKPETLVRVMIARTEVLTPALERQIEQWVVDLASPQFAVRQAADASLSKLGRLGEPALRRVLAGRPTLEVRHRIDSLLEKAAKKE